MTQVTDTATVVVFNQIEELRIERRDDAWAAVSLAHSGCVGYGDTLEKSIQNARELLADRLRGD